MLFKLERKKKLNKSIIFVRLSVLVKPKYNQSLRRESNFILICIFNYVSYKVSPHHPLVMLSLNFCLPVENLQSVTKIVRLAPPPPLFNVGCKFAYSFLVLAAWHGFFRLGTTLSQREGGILGNFNQA